jgi:hypothetical protein
MTIPLLFLVLAAALAAGIITHRMNRRRIWPNGAHWG